MNKPDPTSTSGLPPAFLVNALRHVMRPMVRLLLNHALTYPYFIQLMKGVYFEVARKEFSLPNKPPTDSRISLLTGLHRKDVNRLREEAPVAQPHSATANMGAQLVAMWMGDPRFVDAQGQPRPLPRLSSEGGSLSFEGLVEQVSKDIRSRSVLDEWLRLGVVHLDAQNRVVLNTEAFVPQEGFEEKVFFFGQNVHDHLAAVVHNLKGGQPPFLERSVYYDGLSEESVRELAALSRGMGMEALLAINRRAMALQARDKQAGNQGQRMNFGVYYYSESQPEETHEHTSPESKTDEA